MTTDKNTVFSIFCYIFITFLAILSTIPPFISDYIIAHDLITHLNWTELFHQQLFAGDYYPRWLFDMNGGRGSPVFYFYSPLPYYVSALFSVFIPSENATWHSIGATYCFAFLVSSLGLFYYFKMLTSQSKAFVFTVLCMLFPYHIAIDLYLRFAFTEFFAIAWIPYLFIFTKKLSEGKKYASCALSITYALLILSHIPTTLLISPFLLIYYFICFRQSDKPFVIIAPFIMGGLMAAFYLLPIIELKNEVSLHRMTTGRFYYENAFLIAGDKLNPESIEFLSLLNYLSISAALTTAMAFLSIRKPGKTMLFFAFMSFFSIFMMYQTSQIIWTFLPFLELVQFPWRFFIVVSFSVYFLIAYISNDNVKINKYFYYTAVSMLVSLSLLTIHSIYLKTMDDISEEDKVTILLSVKNRRGPVEYFTAGTPEIYYNNTTSHDLERTDKLFIGRSRPITSSFTINGPQIEATIESPEKQVIILNQFYFPTWVSKYLTDGKVIELNRTPDGFLEFTLDKGVHSIIFFHKKTSYEFIGMIISFFAIFYVLLRLTCIFFLSTPRI